MGFFPNWEKGHLISISAPENKKKSLILQTLWTLIKLLPLEQSEKGSYSLLPW